LRQKEGEATGRKSWRDGKNCSTILG